MKRFLLLLLVSLSMQCACAQEEEVVIQTIKVTDSIYMLQGAGGNIGVSVGADGVFMIDDQFAPLSEKISSAIGELSEHPVEFIVNTHWHFDHTGGNENFGKAGAKIVAHRNVRERMSDDQFMKVFDREVKAAPPVALPVITFTQEMSFHYNGEEIRIVHVPRGHTDGDSLLHFTASNVIHTGDLLFNGSYPFVDTQAGGSLEGVIKSAEMILKMANEDTKIIPGHGPLASRSDIVEYHAMLVDVRGRLLNYLNEGLTLMQVSTRNPLDDYNDKWGQGFMKPQMWLRIIYQDLASQ